MIINLAINLILGCLSPATLLFAVGLVAIYSSTFSHPTASGNFERQLIWGIAAYIIFFITYSLPTKSFKLITVPTYLFSLLFLIVVMVIGRKVSGARSWLDLGPFGFQPSEFGKIGTILAMSAFLKQKKY